MIRPRRPVPARRPAAEPLEPRGYFAALAFAPAESYAAGSNPAALATGDLNGDGKADLVVANYSLTSAADTLTVLTGDGTGTFDANAVDFKPTQYDVATSLQAVAVGDLNGDGFPDVVAVGAANNFAYVLLNNGDGTLGPAIPYPVGAGPEAVALADVYGNGRLDIVTANQQVAGLGSVTVLANDGHGGFGAPALYDGGSNPDALAVADLNGDGRPDVVTVDPENDDIHVLLNQGLAAGTFPLTPTDYTTDTAGRAVTIADVNNDARPDVIVADLRSATVSVFLNNGDGTLKGESNDRTGGFPFSVVAADLNGDNRPELVTADDRDNAVGIVVHDPTGGFVDRDTNPLRFATGQSPQAVVAVDLNGDGHDDLVTADFNDGQVGVLLNQTVYAPLAATVVTVAAARPSVEVGDPLTLTATVQQAPTATDPDPAPLVDYPAGRVVQFLSGPKLLGLGKLTADGTATITTKALPVGTPAITAQYGGNAHYTPGSAAVNEAVLAAADPLNVQLVAPTAVVVTSRAGRAGVAATRTATRAAAAVTVRAAVRPAAVAGTLLAITTVNVNGVAGAPVVPGGTGSVAVSIADQGAAPAIGSVLVTLSVAPTADVTADLAAAVALPVVGTATVSVGLVAGHAVVAPVGFRLPTGLTAGDYTIVATLAPPADHSITAAQIDATPVASATSVPVTLVLVPFVPGDAGTVAVTLTNQGTGPARGSVTVSLSLAPVGDAAAAVPLATVGTTTFAVNLPGGASRVASVRFTLPTLVAAGDYTILATIAPAATLTAAQVSTAAAATTTPDPIITAFGLVPSGRHTATATALPDGTVVTLALAGPGTGTLALTPVTAADGTVSQAVDLDLVGTTAASTVSITAAGNAAVTINSFVDNYRLGGLLAPTTTVAHPAGVDAATDPSQAAFNTAVARVTLAGLTDSNVSFGPYGHAALSLGTVAHTALFSHAPLASVAVASWTATAGDVLDAPAILGALTSGGDFGPTLALSGAYTPGPRTFRVPHALGSATIAGTLTSPTWTIGTAAGPVRAAAVAPGFVGTAAGAPLAVTVTAAPADDIVGRRAGR